MLAAAALALDCGGTERTSLRRDVRLEVAHDPPASAPAGAPFLLGARVVSDPPLPAGSAHVWFRADGEWERLPLEPLAGTERVEAELPAQPRGRTVRYYFTVQSPLGEVVRLPEARRESGAPSATAEQAYTLVARAPVARWTGWLRGLGAGLGLILVLSGAALAVRRGVRERGSSRRAHARLAAAGLGAFLLAGVAGAAVASLQATGDPLREVSGAWWAALVLWTLLVLLLLGTARSGRSLRGPLAALVVGLAGAGAVAVFIGVAGGL